MTPFVPNTSPASVGMILWCFLCGFNSLTHLETSCPLAERSQTFCILCLSTLISASLNWAAKERFLWAMCTEPWCGWGAKILCYKGALCWLLDSLPTVVRKAHACSFSVERNAPQKRPVLLAKSRQCTLKVLCHQILPKTDKKSENCFAKEVQYQKKKKHIECHITPTSL